MKKLVYTLFIAVALLAACKPKSYATQGVVPNNTRINTVDTAFKPDSNMLRLIAPYKTRLDSQMNVVIGTAEVDLPNTRPNGLLGNFIADILKDETSKAIKRDVDFAFTNISGIRLPSLPKGPVTQGKIFELLPFDNMVVAAEVSGETLKKMLEMIAAKGGEAISGFHLTIKDKQLVRAIYKGTDVDFNRTYIICTNDFIFNGGDNYLMFKHGVIKQYATNITIRDMVMGYINKLNTSNLAINPAPDERITVQ
ncbi:MAG TPA: 5'-nucleotidase [Bacteroidia bacterium]|nr:5'-nucleotidase [Bacteroidia bacterium]